MTATSTRAPVAHQTDHAPRVTAASYRAAGLWRGDRTLLDDLDLHARRRPARPATITYAGDQGTALDYAGLASYVDQAAANLVRLGVRPDDVVTLQLPNSWELNVLVLACYRMGAVPMPVVPIMRRREVAFMTTLTGSSTYIAAATHRGFSFAAMSRGVAEENPGVVRRILLDNDDPAALDLHTELFASVDPLPAGHATARPDSLSQIMFTSGTTGEPKGVMHTQDTMHAINLSQVLALGLEPDEVVAMGSPTTHQAGFTWNLVMPLLLGATSVHVDRWDVELMLDLVERHRVTFFMGAPAFLSDMVRAQRERPRDLSSLRTFATGSAPIPPVLVEDAQEVLGCRVRSLWGMTENGCVTITRPTDDRMRASRSDGSAVAGMEVRIVDRDTREPVDEGETGVLTVRGAGQCVGYYARPDVYAAQLDDDGWFDTGDLARSDGEGGIRIAGRVKDVIIRGGENVPVTEIEGLLLRHPAVADVAVVGVPDPRLGERACAVVVPDGDAPTLAQLVSHLDVHGTAKPYWPERLEVVPDLPRTPSGKVRKVELRESLAESAHDSPTGDRSDPARSVR